MRAVGRAVAAASRVADSRASWWPYPTRPSRPEVCARPASPGRLAAVGYGAAGRADAGPAGRRRRPGGRSGAAGWWRRVCFVVRVATGRCRGGRQTVQVKDSKGMGHLARWSHPGGGDPRGGAAGRGRRDSGCRRTWRCRPLLDASAKGAYKRRVTQLRGDLDEAETMFDSGRAARAAGGVGVLDCRAGARRGVGRP